MVPAAPVQALCPRGPASGGSVSGVHPALTPGHTLL